METPNKHISTQSIISSFHASKHTIGTKTCYVILNALICVGIMSKFAFYNSLLENPTLELYTVYVRSKCCTTEAFGEIATKQRYSF